MRKQIDDLVGLKQMGVGVCVPGGGGDKEQGMVHKPPHARVGKVPLAIAQD